jgi:hypothetical protein
MLLFNIFYICMRPNTHFFGLGSTSELETLKIATDSTVSQIFTFVVDTKNQK